MEKKIKMFVPGFKPGNSSSKQSKKHAKQTNTPRQVLLEFIETYGICPVRKST